MAANILVVTHEASFGESIRLGLEEAGQFTVHVAEEPKKAVSFLLETDCTLAFIDSGLNPQEIQVIVRRLRETRPALRLVVITEPGGQMALDDLSPEEILSKPFNQPDLLAILTKLLPRNGSQENTPGQDKTDSVLPPWLSDVNRAAQHLTRLTLGSSAQAALITNGEKLWAYAGHLPQSAAHELAATVTRYWDRVDENDLVRFVRLVSTDAEHMLYATRLAPGTVLALVFDAETPFSTIRSQANQLVHSLSDLPGEEEPVPSGNRENIEKTPLAAPSNTTFEDTTPYPTADPGTDNEVNGLTRTNRVKETIRRIFSSSQDLESDKEVVTTSQKDDLNAASPRIGWESSPAISGDMGTRVQEEPLTRPLYSLQPEQELAVTLISRATRKAEAFPTQDDSVQSSEPQSEKDPDLFSDQARKIVLEPISASVYNLDYACLLVPRFTHHHLTGDLSVRLGEWIPLLCIAFAWRLEFISVRPEYLLWIVNVPPAASPGYLMRIMRQHVSDKIFSEFPRFKKENPSGDFWAPGYLIMGGSQPPPTQLIKDFIAQTRHRQGIF